MARRAPLPAPLPGPPRATGRRSVRRTQIALGSVDAQRRLPVPHADRAPRRRGAAGASRRSAPTTTPSGPDGRRPASPARSSPRARCGWPCRCWRRPEILGADRLADLRRSTSRKPAAAVIFAPNHHSHLDTPLADHGHPRAVARAARRRRRRRLLLRPATLTGAASRARRSTRSRSTANVDRAAVGRPGPRAHRRRLEPRDLPRGRPLTRRLGAAVQGRRRLPVGPDRRARRARVHRRHRLDLRQGHEAPEAGQDEGHVRLAAAARATDESTRRFNDRIEQAVTDARRRGADRLVDGPPAGRAPGPARR